MAESTWLDEQLEHRDVELSAPIRVDGQEVTRLRIREPVARDLRVGKRNSEDENTQLQAILASCTGVPLASIGMLRMRDYMKCAEALSSMGFTAAETPSSEGSDGSLPTGNPPSA